MQRRHATRFPFPAAILMCGIIGGGFCNELHAAEPWRAGFSRVVITPDKPMFATGYGSRNKPSDGKIHDLYVRAAALRDPAGHTSLFLAMDLIGISKEMENLVCDHARKKFGLKRADVMLCCSHTHCGPALAGKLSHMLALKDADWKRINENQKSLNANLIKATDLAMADLTPAKLFTGNGKTVFAVNRRKPIGTGPTDHDVPVLRVTSADGKTLRGVIFGYACHNTVLSFYQWCGDYAGFAQLAIEDRHEDAVALFFTGCGADQNPLPRRKVELAEKYGRMLAKAVDDVMKAKMQIVTGELRTAFQSVELVFDKIPSEAYFEQELAKGNRYQKARARLLLADIEKLGALPKTHTYPVQVWAIGGNVELVALGGEVVVDYSLRLKKELGKGRTWVAGYANHVMAYIPSERILKEGGYEGGTSMLYYQLPTRWKTGLEQQIVNSVKELVAQVRPAARQTISKQPAIPKDTLPKVLDVNHIPRGLAAQRTIPKDNPLTPARVALGRRLFFDGRLSSNGKVACASCHRPDHGFSTPDAKAVGIGGQIGKRNAPSLLNRAYGRSFFWDGRVASLEEQALKPIANSTELDSSVENVVKKLAGDATYREEFSKAFRPRILDGTEPVIYVNATNLAKALAAFQRTLLLGDSPVDRFRNADAKALTDDERQGLWLFESKANCWKCHSGNDFTDENFHNTGAGWGSKDADLGRFFKTGKAINIGEFKTPTLRGVALTAPYMHDGGVKTLTDVVNFYNRGGNKNPALDPKMEPLKLNKKEVAQLVAFLEALSRSGDKKSILPPLRKSKSK